jgi:hypothetical protein
MPTVDLHRDWKTLLSYLPKEFRALAEEHKQLQTQYGNAKITTADELLRLILLHVGGNLPLLQTVTLVAQAGGPKLSAMRLHMKMRKAAPYLRALVERMFGHRAQSSPERWAGYDMVVVDSTAVAGPGAVATDARLHTKLRLSDVSLRSVEVTDITGAETFKRFMWEPGELAIADRGFCNAPGVAHVVGQGGEVLVRLNRGAMPVYGSNGQRVDVLAWVKSLRDQQPHERAVTLDAERDGEPLGGRLIAVRLPADKAAQARQRLKAMRASKTTAESLEAAGYVILFTTAPEARMSASRCLDAYRLRWQIELRFKRWKSIGGLDRLPNYRDDTILAWLYAKVLLGLLLDRMCSICGEVFPPVLLAPQRPPWQRWAKRPTLDPTAIVEAGSDAAPTSALRPAAARVA